MILSGVKIEGSTHEVIVLIGNLDTTQSLATMVSCSLGCLGKISIRRSDYARVYIEKMVLR